MKQFIILLFVASTFLVGQEKVIVRKMIDSDTQDGSEIEITIENDDLNIAVEKDGKEEVFSVKLNNLEEVELLLQELKEKGIMIELDELMPPGPPHIKRGYLGVNLSDLTDQLRSYFGVKGNGGVLISEVTEDSPAEKAGLKAGDIVLKADKTLIDDAQELSRYVGKQDSGAVVVLSVIRKAKTKTIKATLGTWGKDHMALFMPHMKGSWKGQKRLKNTFIFEDDFDGKPNGKKRMMIKKMDGERKTQKELRKEMKKMRKEMEKLKKEMENLKN